MKLARTVLVGTVLALALLLVAAAVGVVRVGPAGPSMTTDGFPILVAPPPPDGILPTIGCAPEGITGVLRLDPETGLAVGEHTVVWPHDYLAVRDGGGARLLDEHGEPIALTGDTVTLDGGFPDEAGRFVACGRPSVEPAAVQVGEPGATAPPTPPAECPAALLEGTLVLDPDGGLGIRAERGDATVVRWPPTFAIRVDGTEAVLLDETGAPVARAGDRIAVGGGMSASGDAWIVCPWQVQPVP